MVSKAIETMRKLADGERELMSGFERQVDLDALSYPQYLIAVERLSREVFSCGRTDFPFAAKTWGDGAYIMPLPLLLIVQSNPIVDIPAAGEEKIIESFGVTAKQLRDLASAGLVELNLVSEYQIDKDDSAYCHDFNVELLNPLLTGCKVNGIRRRKLFEVIGFPKAHQDELLNRYRALYRPMITKQGLQAYNDASGGGAPAHRIDDAVEQLAFNTMYLNLLGPNRGHYENDPYLTIRESDPIEEIVARIRGRKSYLCTPITANFGGTTNYTPVQYQKAHDSCFGGVDRELNKVDRGTERITQFVLAYARSRQTNTAWNGKGLEFPIKDGRVFNDVLSFLKDNREQLEKSSVMVGEINSLATQTDRELSLHQISEIYDDVVANTKHVSDPLMSQALAGAAGAVVFEAASKTHDVGVERFVEAKSDSEEEDSVDLAKRGFLKSVGCATAGAASGIATSEALEHSAPDIPIDVYRSRTIVASFFDGLIIRRS